MSEVNRVEVEKPEASACCGGPSEDPGACCVNDAEARAAGASGCGCGVSPRAEGTTQTATACCG
jgi:hypothetical protein